MDLLTFRGCHNNTLTLHLSLISSLVLPPLSLYSLPLSTTN